MIDMSLERELGRKYLLDKLDDLLEHDSMSAAEWLDYMDPDFEIFAEDVEDDGPEFQEFWVGYDEALRALTGDG